MNQILDNICLGRGKNLTAKEDPEHNDWIIQT